MMSGSPLGTYARPFILSSLIWVKAYVIQMLFNLASLQSFGMSHMSAMAYVKSHGLGLIGFIGTAAVVWSGRAPTPRPWCLCSAMGGHGECHRFRHASLWKYSRILGFEGISISRDTLRIGYGGRCADDYRHTRRCLSPRGGLLSPHALFWKWFVVSLWDLYLGFLIVNVLKFTLRPSAPNCRLPIV